MDAAQLKSLPTRTLIKMAIGAKLKAVADGFMPAYHGTFSSFFLGLPRTHYNYAGDVGDGLASSVVMPVVQWIQRAFPEAPVIVQKRVKDEWETVSDHPLAALLEQPNPFYAGAQLWMCTVADWCWWGESYWRILSSRGGQPAELWWCPPWSITPQWPADGSVFISHYVYGPESNSQITLDPEEVVHFRHGLDPRNLRHGLPPLRAVLQDIWIDAEAGVLVGALLRNMGIPGMIISPKSEQANLSPAEAEQVKQYVSSRFTGDKRGDPLVFGAPTDVHRLAFSPNDLNMSTFRNTAEERVSAALGIAAAVVGFGTGLEQSKVGATMSEMRKLSWQNGIIPIQRIMAAELSRTLLPWYEEQPDKYRVWWDYDEVEALQESRDDLAKRYAVLYDSGILTRAECREAQGYESDEEDEVYKLPINIELIGPGAPEPEPLPALPALPPANGNRLPAANENGNGAVQQRAWVKQSLDEWIVQSIGRRAERLEKPPAELMRVATRIMREERRLQPKFQKMLLPVFRRYGEHAVTAMRELFPQKASAEDVIRAAIVGERIPLASVRFELAQIYEQMAAQMVDLIIKTFREGMNVELTTDARVRAMVQQAAQERATLLDLAGESRDALLRSLDEATQQGLSQDALVDLVRQRVPSGRWSTPEIRAEIIARTEGRYFANLASSRVADETGVGKCLILDALLGPTDTTCEVLAGAVVSASEARTLAASEHTNGTRLVLSMPVAVSLGVG